MDRGQTAAVLHIIKTAYPNFGGSASSEDIVTLWTDMFSDAAPDVVVAAVRSYIQTGKFPPTIADIRALVTDMTMPLVTPGEIWGEAHRLLSSGISPNDPETAYSRMSDVCREAVLAVGGWYVLSMSDENDPHIRRTFLQSAQARIQRDRERGISLDRSRVNTLSARNTAFLTGGATHG